MGGRCAFRRRRKAHEQRRVTRRTLHQRPTAVGACATQVLGAVCAPGALERADEGVGTGRVQVAIAALAVWLHALHVGPLRCWVS